MRAAFNLLETATAPVIEDYPIEAPAEAGPEAWTCPVNYPVDDGDTLRDRLQAEVTRLGPWALETRRKRGRTFFGASGASVDQVAEVARALAEGGRERRRTRAANRGGGLELLDAAAASSSRG